MRVKEIMACLERRVLTRIYEPIIENKAYHKKPGINAYLISKRTEWAGYVCRSNGIIKKDFEEKVDEKRPRGQHRQCWINRVNDDLNKCL